MKLQLSVVALIVSVGLGGCVVGEAYPSYTGGYPDYSAYGAYPGYGAYTGYAPQVVVTPVYRPVPPVWGRAPVYHAPVYRSDAHHQDDHHGGGHHEGGHHEGGHQEGQGFGRWQ